VPLGPAPGYLTAWTWVVWATRRSSESYKLVWAETVVRPRCSGTATARTVPLLTGRNIWLAGGDSSQAAVHGVTGRPARTPLGRFLGYATAWLEYQLRGNATAAGAFTGAHPELASNTDWPGSATR
jgi:hypothetical protein